MGFFDVLNTIKNDIGGFFGGVEHGVENFFHIAPPPGAQNQQQAQTGAQVGSGLGYGPTPAQTALAAASKPTAPAVDPAAQLNAYIQNLAGVGPKAVNTPAPASPPAKQSNPLFGTAAAIASPVINPFTSAIEGVLGTGTAGEETVPTGGQSSGVVTNAGQQQSIRDQAIAAVQARLLMSGGLGKGLASGAESLGGQVLNQASRFGNVGAASGALNAATTDQTQGASPADIFKNAAQQAALGYVGGAVLGGADKFVRGAAPGVLEDNLAALGKANAAMGEAGGLNQPEPKLGPSEALQNARGLMEASGQTADQLKMQVTGVRDGLIRNEMGAMLNELRAGKVENGGLVRDANAGSATEGQVTGRFGRFSTNPEWYKALHRDPAQAGLASVSKKGIESAISNGRTSSKLYQHLQSVAIRRLSGQYNDPVTGPVPANKQYLGANTVLKGIAEHQAQPAEMSPADLQWAKDNGFAPKDLPFKGQDETIAAQQAAEAKPPKGPHAGNSKAAVEGSITELHAKNPTRNTPETPMISGDHLDIPGKAPVDIKAAKIKLAPPKTEKALVRGFSSIKTIIRRQGAAGKELAQRMVNVREAHAQLGQTFRDAIPTWGKLSSRERFNMAQVAEGKAAPKNARVARAVTEWQNVARAVEDRASKARGDGILNMGHIEDYFPHSYKNSLFTDKKTFTAAAEHLVNSGQATDLQNAVEMINQMREPWQGGHRFGNLEQARSANIPGYRTDKNVLYEYLDKAARRIAEAEQFGRDNEHVSGLIAQMAKEGKDANAAQEAFNSYWQRPANGALAKTAGGVRKVTNALTLSKAVISHSLQTVNTAIVAGNVRTAGAWMRSLSPADRAWVRKIGVNYDGKAGGKVSVVAPFLKQMRAQNRTVSALAGRAYGNALARAGKVDELKNKWGVQGPIGKKLTPEQQAHMGHAMADKTQFSDDPADLPTWARTPGGKLVGQYRMSYQYKQGGFLFDNLIKEAGRGNLMPLIRAGVLVPVAGAAVIEAKHLLGNKSTPGSDLLQTAEAGGLGNVPLSIADSFKYMHDAKTAVEGVAGDIAPLAGEAATTAYNTVGALNGNTKALGKQALGYIPFVGGLVKNAVYPSTPADPNAIAYVQGEQSFRKQLTGSRDQGVWDALFGSNKDKAGNKIPSVYDPQNSPYVAQALLDHPEVLKQATAFFQKFNSDTGQAIDPLYNLNPQQQIAALQIRAAAAFPGELSGDKKQLATELPANWQQQETDYYNAVAASIKAAGGPDHQPGSIPYPTPSAQVQANLNAGNTKDPGVQAWLDQLSAYNNAKRDQMGLPQIAPYGYAAAGNQIPNPNNPYAKKLQAGTSANPTFANSGGGGSRGGRRASAGVHVSKTTGRLVGLKAGGSVKSVKMPKIASAKPPKIKGLKVAKVARVKAIKTPKLAIRTKVKLA